MYSQQPTTSWAPCHHGVCPQWWRPRQTAGKLSPAPCTALALYSWPCGFLVIHQGKPWRHYVSMSNSVLATGFCAAATKSDLASSLGPVIKTPDDSVKSLGITDVAMLCRTIL